MLINHFECQGIHPPCMATHAPAGRPIYFQPNWLKITQDRWVLNTIQGYMIDFESQPHQPSVPQPSVEWYWNFTDGTIPLLQYCSITKV